MPFLNNQPISDPRVVATGTVAGTVADTVVDMDAVVILAGCGAGIGVRLDGAAVERWAGAVAVCRQVWPDKD
jgi:hypothetical protein